MMCEWDGAAPTGPPAGKKLGVVGAGDRPEGEDRVRARSLSGPWGVARNRQPALQPPGGVLEADSGFT